MRTVSWIVSSRVLPRLGRFFGRSPFFFSRRGLSSLDGLIFGLAFSPFNRAISSRSC